MSEKPTKKPTGTAGHDHPIFREFDDWIAKAKAFAAKLRREDRLSASGIEALAEFDRLVVELERATERLKEGGAPDA